MSKISIEASVPGAAEAKEKVDALAASVDKVADSVTKAKPKADELATSVDKVGEATNQAKPKLEELNTKQEEATKKTHDVGRATLEASRAFEDMQYGISGVLNNIPGLIQSLGGGAGLAGIISVAAVAATQFAKHLGGLSEEEQKANIRAINMAQTHERMAQAIINAANRLDDQREKSKSNAELLAFSVDRETKAYVRQREEIDKVIESMKNRNQLANNEAEAEKRKQLAEVDAGSISNVEKTKAKGEIERKFREDAQKAKFEEVSQEIDAERLKGASLESQARATEARALEAASYAQKGRDAEERAKALQAEKDDARLKALELYKQSVKELTGSNMPKLENADSASINDILDMVQKRSDSVGGGEQLRQQAWVMQDKQKRGDLDIQLNDAKATAEMWQQQQAALKDANAELDKIYRDRKAIDEKIDALMARRQSQGYVDVLTNQTEQIRADADVKKAQAAEAEKKARAEEATKRQDYEIGESAGKVAGGLPNTETVNRMKQAALRLEAGDHTALTEVLNLSRQIVSRIEAGVTVNAKTAADVAALKRRLANLRTDDNTGGN